MNSVQPISTAPRADGARLPCRAHAPGYGKERGSLPGEPSIPEWVKWLTAQSGELCEPPQMGIGRADGRILPDAPGEYVRL
jgi:hypothetical protein